MSNETTTATPPNGVAPPQPKSAIGTSSRWSRWRRSAPHDCLLDATLHAIEVCCAESVVCPGISTGITGLDQLTGGLHPEHLVVVSGRPGIGKTSLVLNMALASGASGIPTLVVTGEQTSFEIEERMLGILSGMDGRRFGRGGLEYLEWKNLVHPASRELSRRPIAVLDPPTLRIAEIETSTEYFFSQDWRATTDGVPKATNPEGGLLIVDSLHSVLPRHRSDTAERDLSETVRALKSLARELGISVLVTSHLNRSGDGYREPPRLAELRGSGAIEYCADAVLFISGGEDALSVNLAKTRYGPAGETPVIFDRTCGRFSG